MEGTIWVGVMSENYEIIVFGSGGSVVKSIEPEP